MIYVQGTGGCQCGHEAHGGMPSVLCFFLKAVFVFSLLFSGHAATDSVAQVPQMGKATYYSKRATGSRTSSGERLHHDSLTCAHRTFPFGTKLKVTDPNTKKWVVVRVTDRGPFKRGRIIDLSWRAAKELGILSQGVAMVIVEPVDTTIVPFKPMENLGLPELDFENTIPKYSIKPTWQELEDLPSTQASKEKSK
ncbi:MAG: septal ring lytic transglycosylase RlpA family protein [Prevotella sp.]